MINPIFVLTQAAVIAQTGAVSPITFTAFNGAALGTSNPDASGYGWEVIAMLAGSDLQVEVNTLPAAALAGGPGLYNQVGAYSVEFTDGNNQAYTVNLDLNALFETAPIPNALPVGVADTFDVSENSSIVFDVAANDTDADGTIVSVNILSNDPALVVTASGTDVTVSLANGTAPGDYDFTYAPVDNEGGIGAATTVTVTVPAGSTNLFDPNCWTVDNTAPANNSVTATGFAIFENAPPFDAVITTPSCYPTIPAGVTQLDLSLDVVTTNDLRWTTNVRFFDSGGGIISTDEWYDTLDDGLAANGTTVTAQLAIPAGAVNYRLNVQNRGTGGFATFTNYGVSYS